MNNIKLLPNLLAFAEVARRGSFTAAANHLGLSKSAVSQQISRLEKQLGLQLLTRNTRGMSLTSIGAKLLARSELLKDQVELAFQELASAEEMPSGTFAITAPHAFETSIVVPAIKQLCAEFPSIEPQITITDEPLDLIKNNLDVAIYAGDLRDSSYRTLPLGSLVERFCASPNYIQQHGMPITVTDLNHHKWIAANWQKDSILLVNKTNRTEEAQVTLKPYARCNSISGVIDMAKQHMGIAFLPNVSSDSLIGTGGMVPILPDYIGPKWPTFFMHAFQGEKPIHVSRFYELIRYYLNKTTTNR